MTELRAPDPTLTSHKRTQFVYITDEGDDLPATAHASHYRGRQCAGPISQPVLSAHARWFAVPCRECFPEAPPPGTNECHRPRCVVDHSRHLAWQVPA